MLKDAEFLSYSVEDTISIGERIGKHLACGDVVALSGELGVGKTVLCKGIVKGLGGNPDVVSSPIFLILHIYSAKVPVYHLDLYRIEYQGELWGIGYEEYLYGDGVCVVEWAEKALNFLPQHTVFVGMEFVNEHKRRIVVERESHVLGN